MTSNAVSKRTSPLTKIAWLLFAHVAALAIMTLPTGCATASSEPKVSQQIYQPRVLRLKAGLPVQTTEGTYVPQTDEVWHSPAAFDALESQLINTAAALAQEQNRR